MSTVPPPGPPTDPLRPAPPTSVLRERVVAPAVDPNVILVRLENALASLRTALVVVGLIAVAATGLAIYALLNDDDAGTRGPGSGLASDARVTQLADRVDGLSRQIQTQRAAAAPGDVAALGARVDQLSRQIQTLRPAASGSGITALAARVSALESTVGTLASRPAATQAIQQLSSRVDALASDVASLKQSQTP